jgi:hypothetical protein
MHLKFSGGFHSGPPQWGSNPSHTHLMHGLRPCAGAYVPDVTTKLLHTFIQPSNFTTLENCQYVGGTRLTE